ncbi:ABC transporter ATP-binding protein [Sciscionella marina]|uniref:ABC transporter ATP-binding protein n=1 Tax=Sciscionella marina TaxID=508770 RepID=UPI00036B8B42|nr:ABC transporter ATP-binding protein [Sciscionella marina]
MLDIDRVAKTLGDRTVLQDVSLSVPPGERVAVLGPNGAGKSTLLKLVTGVWRPDHGSVRIGDAAPRERTGRLRLGAVFQEPGLDPFMTARETLRMHGVLYGLSGRPLARRCAGALEEVELTELGGRENRHLSGGQRRRLELARCLVHQASVIVLDEPTAGLDPLARESLWATIDRLRAERGIAVLFTTHHFEEIDGCDRVFRLRAGRLEDCGAPDRAAFVSAFAH